MKLMAKYVYNPNVYCFHFSRINHPLKCSHKSSHNFRSFSDLKTYLSEIGSKHPQKKCEKFWSDFWQKNKLFSEEKSKKCSEKPVFSLLLPPPNITGSLHLGHALTLSIEDAICRYHRMKGHTVRWIPGLDHAGIATQLMVEKMLWTKHKKTRHDMTREEFLAEVNVWKTQRSNEIMEQFLRLGVSLDFDKQFYTLSEEMSEAVNKAFIRLFNSGQIYRRSQAVNWSYYLRSTISDIEVEHQEVKGPNMISVPGFDGKVLVGVIHHFNYPIEDNASNVIPVATTRLETILGDVAVAVHPEDNRYSHLIGKNAIHPLNGRRMPIIADKSVSKSFGTGAVKITPGHSAFDYAIAEEHCLPIIDIFDESGRLRCPELPKFNGLHRFEAKNVMKTELQDRGLYLAQYDHKQTIPICSRSGDLIDTRRVPQWFVKWDKQRFLAQFVVNRDQMSKTDEQNWNSLKGLLNEEDTNLSIISPNYRYVWNEWFKNYEDWCISRQIFWGHRIPAFNVIKDNKTTDEWIAAKNESEALSIAQNKYPESDINVKQDNDVLDTWFSSALLPLSINGWPKSDLSKNSEYFPLSLMETGHDIIFFWVARMVLMSLSLTNKLPFPRVLLHGMVCDADRKKMSKSKGNVIDPIDIIDGISLKAMKEKNSKYLKSGVLSQQQFELSMRQLEQKFPKGIIDCGADALRYHLLQTHFKKENVYFSAEHVIANRNFCNKMHQTIRFLIANIDHNFHSTDILSLIKYLSPIDRWIISCLVEAIKKCNQSFASYDLQYGALQLRHFWQNQLCDIYLEHIKTIVYNTSEENQLIRNTVLNVMTTCVLTSLRAIHPFMPFISENLWQHIQQRLDSSTIDKSFKSICDENYPDFSSDEFMAYFDFDVKQDMRFIDGIVKKIRWFRQNFRVPKNLFTSDVLIAVNGNHLEKYSNLMKNMSKVNGIKFVSIHDINRYDKYFCYKIQLEDNRLSDEESDEESEESLESKKSIVPSEKNSPEDCYVLFDIDVDSLMRSMSESGIKQEIIDQKLIELNEYKCIYFHNNFWRNVNSVQTHSKSNDLAIKPVNKDDDYSLLSQNKLHG